MPPRPKRQLSGYAILAQAEEETEEDYDDLEDDPFKDPPRVSLSGPEDGTSQPKRRQQHMRVPSGDLPRRPRRKRANSTVDIKAINARLERWAEEIKERFTRRRIKGKSAEEETLEIHHSVFVAPDGVRPVTKQDLESDIPAHPPRMSKLEFDDIVESVRTAIELGLQPTLISQGSSGSYFARNSGGKVVGVFKPKDEEPYANKNPKWTKWIHRNLFPFAFGRACLIPNLSYVSEAAAYTLDLQLRTNIVPYTAVVSLSSKSFHYDYFDRKAYHHKNKPLPEKLGSFQVFLKGFKGATEFLREHPWPDGNTNAAVYPTKKRRRKRWDETCRPSKAHPTEEVETDEETELSEVEGSGTPREFWTSELQQSFRGQLERLVILDYIMRNTDRGLDNWMIKIDETTGDLSILPAAKDDRPQQDRDGTAEEYRRRDESMTNIKHVHRNSVARIGAIDNSLSWPWKHPDAWRSFPFGWLFLSVDMIGKPFSEATRQHFLPLLTSKDWWTETQVRLRRIFEIDADFQEKMFARQMAVMKGQAWNVLETLKTPGHGPLELTRRARVCVWDDLVDIPVAMSYDAPDSGAQQSPETQQNASNEYVIREEMEEEEMDISSALDTSRSKAADLIGMATPSREQHENPFNFSRENSIQDNQDLASTSVGTSPSISTKEISASAPRPTAYRSRTGVRTSYDAPRSLYAASPLERRRRFSFSVARGLSFGGRRSFADDDDDDEDDDLGDLGYSAAHDRRNATRKVIVERLEVVKSKTPFFKWC